MNHHRRAFWVWILSVLFCMLVIAQSVLAFDMNESVDLNFSALPVNGSFNLTLVLLENETAYLWLNESDPHVSLSFPGVVNFSSATESFLINYSVGSNFSGNQTLVSSVLINNSVNGVVVSYGFLFNIIDDFFLFNISDVFNIYVLDGDFVANVSTNLLPMNGSFNYAIRGVAGEVLNISCPSSSWLSCPVNDTFGSDNISRFSIDYFIPEDASLGTTEFDVLLSAGNSSRNTTVRFLIRAPDFGIVSYVWREECFTREGDARYVDLDCVEEYETWQITRLARILDIAEETASVCRNNTETVVEYVLTGNYDDEIKSEWDSCKESKNNLEVRYDNCSDSLVTCRDELLANESALMSATFNKAVMLRKEAKEAKDDAERKVRNYWITQLVLFLLAVVSYVGYRIIKKYKDDSWGMKT